MKGKKKGEETEKKDIFVLNMVDWGGQLVVSQLKTMFLTKVCKA